METILNITNGDSAVTVMQQAGIPGAFLPWRDVLHDGPVPGGLSLEQLSTLRAQFILERGWGDAATINKSFTQRDQILTAYRSYSKIKLWFEHDLYDQLQILQLLAWFAEHPSDTTQLSLICTEQYLGLTPPQQLKSLLAYEETITTNHLLLGKRAWTAFTAPCPKHWERLLNANTTCLPFLHGAIIRMLEEYPNVKTGLSRTAQATLGIIASGISQPSEIFTHYQQSEARRFMGDSSFWVILGELLAANPALIQTQSNAKYTLPPSEDLQLSITTAGERVLAGLQSGLNRSSMDRWIGGVRLTPNTLWCWNPELRSLIKQ